MRLLDLNPKWTVLEEGFARVGLTFMCPHCLETHLGVCFHRDGKAAMENEYILAHHGAQDDQHIWDLVGQDDFATLTLSPSIDASKSGHWHGLITNGVCESGDQVSLDSPQAQAKMARIQAQMRSCNEH